MYFCIYFRICLYIFEYVSHFLVLSFNFEKKEAERTLSEEDYWERLRTHAQDAIIEAQSSTTPTKGEIKTGSFSRPKSSKTPPAFGQDAVTAPVLARQYPYPHASSSTYTSPYANNNLEVVARGTQ